jgi:DNA-binding NarL/FixJ family response regulator
MKAEQEMRIAICDDHPVVVDGISMLLHSLDPDIHIERLTCAADLFKAAPIWRGMRLLLLDLGLPDGDGLETLKHLRALRDDVPIVVVSGTYDRRSVLRAIDCGAMGFVPKTSGSQEMLAAFRTVLDGGIYLPHDTEGHFKSPSQADPTLQLTPRQWQILHSVLLGKSVKRIALDNDIAESTVKAHITPILRAMGVTTRTEAIVKAGQIGLRIPGIG